jgi:GT2 family glycosyltransferase
VTSQSVDQRVAVIIACHTEDRWAALGRAIASARTQRPAPNELIVAVDHNQPLSARLRAAQPQVRVVDNTGTRGASGTRNAGAAAATTPLLAFLDDDAVAAPGWLARLLAPLDDPNVVGTGGGVAPLWEAGPPPWFPEEFGWVVGVSYRGMPEQTAPIRNVWSENMAIRRTAFHTVGGFSDGFGKVGRMSRPEDTDLCIRVSAAFPGQTWLYVPDALVHHEVPRSRATWRFFLRRSFWEGRGKVEMGRKLADDRDFAAERAYLRRTLPLAVARHLRTGVRHPGGADLARAGSIVAGAAAAATGGMVSLLWRSG